MSEAPDKEKGATDEAAHTGSRWNEVVAGAVLSEDEAGLVVNPEKLVEFCTYLRDQEGYDLLSNETGVDYKGYPGRDASDRFEVVYHLYSVKNKSGPLVLKARVPEDKPELPSVYPVWPGAELQEDEIWDLYGINFTGHPYLRRILMWDGFNGHPMRKDWKEVFYEDDRKPFKSRWPAGNHVWAEDQVPWQDNVDYPEEFDPETWKEPVTFQPVQAMGDDPDNPLDDRDLSAKKLQTQRLVVNMGPHHPSTHGVFRMVATLEGETVVSLKPVMGYLHRNHEKIGERNTYLMNIPFTDRLDYISSMSNNLAYALAVEKLLGIEPAERAEYIRVIMVELNRIGNHLFAIGALFNDLGTWFTPMLYGLRERELILDLFEEASGARLLYNYMRFGGVAHDLPDGWVEKCHNLVHRRLPSAIDEIDHFLTGSEIVLARTKGVGYLSGEEMIAHSVTGPMLRAAGVPYDIRKVEPYSIYDRFDFEIPCFDGCDVYDRYRLRLAEIRESYKIVQQALAQIPEGDILAGKKSYTVRVPKGEVYHRIESPKGELGFYLVSDGKSNPFRYRVRAPSYINLNALEPMTIGYKVADTVVILGAVDIVLGEVDR